MDAECAVRVSPKEGLFFPPPLNRPIINHISLINENDKPLTFKVKTTSPNSYVVKPRMGVLLARGECKVRILLRAVTKEEDEAARMRDRFQIECRFVTPAEIPDGVDTVAENLWEDKSKPSVKSLIPCSFSASVPASIRLQISNDIGESPQTSTQPAFDQHGPPAATIKSTVNTGAFGGGGADRSTSSLLGQIDHLQRELSLVTHERQQLQREVDHINDRLSQKDAEVQQLKTREGELQKELNKAQAAARKIQRGWVSAFLHSPLWFLMTVLLAWVVWSTYVS